MLTKLPLPAVICAFLLTATIAAVATTTNTTTKTVPTAGVNGVAESTTAKGKTTTTTEITTNGNGSESVSRSRSQKDVDTTRLDTKKFGDKISAASEGVRRAETTTSLLPLQPPLNVTSTTTSNFLTPTAGRRSARHQQENAVPAQSQTTRQAQLLLTQPTKTQTSSTPAANSAVRSPLARALKHSIVSVENVANLVRNDSNILQHDSTIKDLLKDIELIPVPVVESYKENEMSSIPKSDKTLRQESKTSDYIHFYINEEDDNIQATAPPTRATRMETVNEVLSNLFPNGFTDIFRFSYASEQPTPATIATPDTEGTSRTTSAATPEAITEAHLTAAPSSTTATITTTTEKAAQSHTKAVYRYETSVSKEYRRELRPGHTEIVVEKLQLLPRGTSTGSDEFNDGSNLITKDELLRINRAAADAPVLPSLLMNPSQGHSNGTAEKGSKKETPIIILNDDDSADMEGISAEDNLIAESQNVGQRVYQRLPVDDKPYGYKVGVQRQRSPPVSEVNIRIVHDESPNLSQSISQQPIFVPEEPQSEQQVGDGKAQSFDEASNHVAPSQQLDSFQEHAEQTFHQPSSGQEAPSRQFLRNFNPVLSTGAATSTPKGSFHYESNALQPIIFIQGNKPSADSSVAAGKAENAVQPPKQSATELSRLPLVQYDKDAAQIRYLKEQQFLREQQKLLQQRQQQEQQRQQHERLLKQQQELQWQEQQQQQQQQQQPVHQHYAIYQQHPPPHEYKQAQQQQQIQYGKQRDQKEAEDLARRLQQQKEQEQLKTQRQQQQQSQHQQQQQYSSQPAAPSPASKLLSQTSVDSVAAPASLEHQAYRHPLVTPLSHRAPATPTPHSVVFVTLHAPTSQSQFVKAQTSQPIQTSQHTYTQKSPHEYVSAALSGSATSQHSPPASSTPPAIVRRPLGGYTFVEVQKSVNIHNKLITEKDGKLVEEHETIYPLPQYAPQQYQQRKQADKAQSLPQQYQQQKQAVGVQSSPQQYQHHTQAVGVQSTSQQYQQQKQAIGVQSSPQQYQHQTQAVGVQSSPQQYQQQKQAVGVQSSPQQYQHHTQAVGVQSSSQQYQQQSQAVGVQSSPQQYQHQTQAVGVQSSPQQYQQQKQAIGVQSSPQQYQHQTQAVGVQSSPQQYQQQKQAVGVQSSSQQYQQQSQAVGVQSSPQQYQHQTQAVGVQSSPQQYQQQKQAIGVQSSPQQYQQQNQAVGGLSSPQQYQQQSQAVGVQSSPQPYQQQKPPVGVQSSPEQYQHQTQAVGVQSLPQQYQQQKQSIGVQSSPQQYQQQNQAVGGLSLPQQYQQQSQAVGVQSSPQPYQQQKPAVGVQSSPQQYQQQNQAVGGLSSRQQYQQQNQADGRLSSPQQYQQQSQAVGVQSSPQPYQQQKPAVGVQSSPQQYQQQKQAVWGQSSTKPMATTSSQAYEATAETPNSAATEAPANRAEVSHSHYPLQYAQQLSLIEEGVHPNDYYLVPKEYASLAVNPINVQYIDEPEQQEEASSYAQLQHVLPVPNHSQSHGHSQAGYEGEQHPQQHMRYVQQNYAPTGRYQDQHRAQQQTLHTPNEEATKEAHPQTAPQPHVEEQQPAVEKEVEQVVTQQVEKIVERPVHVPYPVHIQQYIDRPYPVQEIVETHVPVPYPVPEPVAVPVHVERYIDRPYPVEKIVEKRVPYPVEKVVEKIVEKEIPIEVEKVVEKIVDRPVPIPIRVPVAIPVPFTQQPLPEYDENAEIFGPSYHPHPNALGGWSEQTGISDFGVRGPTNLQIPPKVLQNYYTRMLKKLLPQALAQRGLPSSSTANIVYTHTQARLKKPTSSTASSLKTTKQPKSVSPSNSLNKQHSFKIGDVRFDLKPPPPPPIGPEWSKGSRYNYNTLPHDLSVADSSDAEQLTDTFNGPFTSHNEPYDEFQRWRNGQTLKRSPQFGRNLQMEYGFKPPLVPSVEINDQGIPLNTEEKKAEQ